MTESEWLADMRRRGIVVTEGKPALFIVEGPNSPGATLATFRPFPVKEDVKLCVPTFRPSLSNPVWEIPVETRSEINLRDFRKRSNRTDAAWRAVSRAFGPQLAYLTRFAADYHAGLPVRVRFTRLGGRRLDRSNLPTSLKAVEDAVAFFLGADDGASNWRAEWEQESCEGMGVRVEFIAP